MLFASTSWLSDAYSVQASNNCLVLLMHWMPWACCLDRARAGSSIAAKMAMIAMTTRSSIRVNASPHRGKAATRPPSGAFHCSIARFILWLSTNCDLLSGTTSDIARPPGGWKAISLVWKQDKPLAGEANLGPGSGHWLEEALEIGNEVVHVRLRRVPGAH